MTSLKQPTLFVPHGGGPWPFVEIPGFPKPESLRQYLTSIPSGLPSPPKALLVISAHWEEDLPTVQSCSRPPMLYDYSGFPPESYEIQWPAPGSPELAAETRRLLSASGIESAEDASRGFDHGTFVVTKLMYPAAELPTIQLSLTRDLSPRRMLEVGAAIAPLREQNVLILGSGYSYHNMRGFFSANQGAQAPSEDSRLFDEWLAETLEQEPKERERRLIEWEKAPRARECHPREEHLLPLMVCAGAAQSDPATLPFRESLSGLHTLAARFG